MTRYLTKSRFKEGWECATRLFYTGRRDFGSMSADDSFLRSLADGGFQIGALAQASYPGGVLVAATDSEDALKETTLLLQQDRIVIFEGAIASGGLLARIDILVKRANRISLIEVKSKSINSRDDSLFNKRSDKSGNPVLGSEWVSYVADVAFQKLVFGRAFPQFEVTSYLMLADKSRRCTVDGLHQHFFLKRDEGSRTSVEIRGLTSTDGLGQPLLTLVDAAEPSAALDRLLAPETFAQRVDKLGDLYQKGERSPPRAISNCRACPYRIDDALRARGLKSGFDLCWQEMSGLAATEIRDELVIDMARLDVEGLVGRGIYKLEDVEENELKVKGDGKPGLSESERKALRLQKLKRRDLTPHFDCEGYAGEAATWSYPLHMIDFETMAAAVPFHRGQRPYEQIAFQFSHHQIEGDGCVNHQSQFLAREPGVNPNLDFVRALRAALSQDQGTIFRYAAHENTILCTLLSQMEDMENPPSDRDTLCAWIREVTHGPEGAEQSWVGSRDMVDMLRLVKRYDYHPATRGSNSIKYVLPAVLADSPYLQKKYGRPVYGGLEDLRSLNFSSWTWLRRDTSGQIINPYKLLPPIHDAIDTQAANNLFGGDEIREGGSASTAYARLQFTEMQPKERKAIETALVKYCELDTFAMVMLWEYWKTLY